MIAGVHVVRTENKKHEAWVEYSSGECVGFRIRENTNLVDGIGGVTWDGAAVLSYALGNACQRLRSSGEDLPHVVELGCGTGLCGLTAADGECKATLTDRCTDLAQLNINQVKEVDETIHSADVTAMDLSWGDQVGNAELTDAQSSNRVTDIVRQRGVADLLIGAEITCLRKQQPLLVSTIAQFLEHSPDALVLLSFDDAPPPNGCRYEEEMLGLMRDRGFRHEVVCVADVDWTIRSYVTATASENGATETESSVPVFVKKISIGTLLDRTMEFVDTSNPLVEAFLMVKDRTVKSNLQPPTKPYWEEDKGDSEAERSVEPLMERVTHERTTHHITLFYRPSAVGECSRCHQTYFRHPVWCNSTPCLAHDSYYCVKFWDCCGEADYSAPGCSEGRHRP